LWLRDWTFNVSDFSPDDPNHGASVEPIYGRKFAKICLRNDFFEFSREHQRQTVTHELIHCHLAAYQHAVETLKDYHPTMRESLEYGVDALADAIGPLLPLPLESKPTKPRKAAKKRKR
jgi:hypothetical protein